MARYPVGQDIRLGGGGNPIQVFDSTGALQNATATTVTLQKPDGTQVTYTTPTNESTGKYHLDLTHSDIATAGLYQWEWDATVSSSHAVTTGSFNVYDPFEVAILSLDDARQHINKLTADTVDDDELRVFVAAVKGLVERETGGPVVNRTITERAEATSGGTTICLRKRPVVSVQSLTDLAAGTTIGITDLEVDTVGGILRRKLQLPFLTWGPFYTVVYIAGWGTAVPPEVNLAARVILGHLWTSQRGPAPGPVFDTQDMTQPSTPGYAIPNMAAELLAPYSQKVYV